MKQLLALAAIALCCISCLKTTDPTPTPVTYISGIYVLNNGNWGSNDSNLATYNYNTKTVTPDIFEAVNDQKLGDLGQDMLVYGNKVYIAVSGSGVIFVTDLEGKILGEVKAGAEGNYQPRALTSYNGFVFASYYEGYVAKIDTVNFNVTLSDKIGNNPEGVAIANKKLYVAISNGLNYPDFDSTVVVMDPLSLGVRKRVTVGLNPGKLVSCCDNIYCLCNGNYSDVLHSMSIIFAADEESEDGVITSKYVINPQQIATDGTRYLAAVVYSGSDYRIMLYDCYIGITYKDSFITDGTKIKNYVTSLDIDPINRSIFVGTSDYINNGDMYVFTAYGLLFDKFDTEGLNPFRTAFSTKTEYIQ